MDKEFTGLFDSGNGENGDDDGRGDTGVHIFMRHYGWIYQTELVAEHEKISLEKAFEIPTINYLNDLAYLKAKGEYMKEQMNKYGNKH